MECFYCSTFLCGLILMWPFSLAAGAGSVGGLGPPLSSPGSGDCAVMVRPPNVSLVQLLVWTLSFALHSNCKQDSHSIVCT